MIEGKKAIDQVALRSPGSIEEILISEDLNADISKYKVSHRLLSSQQLQNVSSVKTSQGIIALVKIPEDAYSDQLPSNLEGRILLLENIQDPGNVGTLIRTAAALKYSGVILSSQCADPFSAKVVQATSGCLFSVWLRKTAGYLEITEFLKKKGFTIAVADVQGEPHINFSAIPKHVLVLGSEGAGLTSDMISKADLRFSIPIESSQAESLNVAVCGGIAMFSGMVGNGW